MGQIMIGEKAADMILKHYLELPSPDANRDQVDSSSRALNNEEL